MRRIGSRSAGKNPNSCTALGVLEVLFHRFFGCTHLLFLYE